MWKRELVWCVVGAVLVVAGWGWAGIEPSFELEDCAWRATDIVVGEQRGWDLRVEEVWTGTVRKGTDIVEPLGIGLPLMPVVVETLEAGAARKTVSGKRVVLFLRREVGEFGREQWAGAATVGRGQVSAVWVEGGKAYSFQQRINPGPVGLWEIEGGEERLKREVAAVLGAKEELAKARGIGDEEERVRALRGLRREILARAA